MKKQKLQEIILKLVPPNSAESSLTAVNKTITEAIQERIAAARAEKEGDGVVLICGTAFIMAEARAAVGIIVPRDGSILSDLLGATNADMQESFVDKDSARVDAATS